jgi:pyruvate/2-oxoglutarate dehydrogenase complex dihydrolipoamide acyltransferase (E2) component
MAITKEKLTEILGFISKENNLSEEILISQVADLCLASPWGSKSAKDFAENKKITLSNIAATGKDGKILLIDVQKAAGVNREKLFPFVSKLAKEEAKNFDLIDIYIHFPLCTRTGINKKSGKKEKITLSDVRRVARVGKDSKSGLYASKFAEDFAVKNGVDPYHIKEKTGRGGKIKKSDIKYFLNQSEKNSDDNCDESDEEHPEDFLKLDDIM